jgi:two-component system sensor histidine kinase KdpD
VLDQAREAFGMKSVSLLERGHSASSATGDRAADRMRTALLAAVSHDLRTPLASAKAATAPENGRASE